MVDFLLQDGVCEILLSIITQLGTGQPRPCPSDAKSDALKLSYRCICPSFLTYITTYSFIFDLYYHLLLHFWLILPLNYLLLTTRNAQEYHNNLNVWRCKSIILSMQCYLIFTTPHMYLRIHRAVMLLTADEPTEALMSFLSKRAGVLARGIFDVRWCKDIKALFFFLSITFSHALLISLSSLSIILSYFLFLSLLLFIYWLIFPVEFCLSLRFFASFSLPICLSIWSINFRFCSLMYLLFRLSFSTMSSNLIDKFPSIFYFRFITTIQQHLFTISTEFLNVSYVVSRAMYMRV